jgi:hypothetical protein
MCKNPDKLESLMRAVEDGLTVKELCGHDYDVRYIKFHVEEIRKMLKDEGYLPDIVEVKVS